MKEPRKFLPKAKSAEADFKTLEHVVLYTDHMDKEAVNVRQRYTKRFHMGLLPDLVSDEAPTVDEPARLLFPVESGA